MGVRRVLSTAPSDPSMCVSSCHSPQKVPAKISPPHAAWRGLAWAGLGWPGLGWLGWAGLGWAGETCGESSLASQRGCWLAPSTVMLAYNRSYAPA